MVRIIVAPQSGRLGTITRERTRIAGNSPAPRKRPFAVANREEELAKRRNINGKRRYCYIGRENEALLAAIRVKNRASPNIGTLPIIFGDVVKIMCNSAVSKNVNLRELLANKAGPQSRTKHAREERGKMIP